MNKIYKVIWSKAKNCYVVVSEIAKRNGKCSSSLNKKIIASFLAAGLVTALPMSVDAATFDPGTGVVSGDYSNAWGNGTYAGGEKVSNISTYKAPGWSKPRDVVSWEREVRDGEVKYRMQLKHRDSGEISYLVKTYNDLLNYAEFEGTTSSINSATAFGKNTQAINYRATAWGNGAIASGSDSTAWGVDTVARGNSGTAFGTYTISGGTLLKDGKEVTLVKTGNFWEVLDANGSTISQSKDYVSARSTLELAEGAYGSNTTAFGQYTLAKGDNATAFGFNTIASANNATAFGHVTAATANRATAFGIETTASGRNSTSFGYSTMASGENATAFGSQTQAVGGGATSWGTQTQARAETSTAWGNKSIVYGGAWTTGETTYSDVEVLRDTSKEEGKQYYIQGVNDSTKKTEIIMADIPTREDGDNKIRENGRLAGYNATAFGEESVTYAENSLAALGGKVGAENSNDGVNSAAIGKDAEVKSNNAYAMGNKATIGTGSTGSVALGGQEGTETMIGNNAANAFAAVGGKVMDDATSAIAIGESSEARVPNSVALGSGSVANRPAGAPYAGWDPLTGKASENTSPTWLSTKAAVSVGDGTSVTRQITGVAAGIEPTDAVNVAQLQQVHWNLGVKNSAGTDVLDVETTRIGNNGINKVKFIAGKGMDLTTITLDKTAEGEGYGIKLNPDFQGLTYNADSEVTGIYYKGTDTDHYFTISTPTSSGGAKVSTDHRSVSAETVPLTYGDVTEDYRIITSPFLNMEGLADPNDKYKPNLDIKTTDWAYATGSNSIAMGREAESSGDNSLAIGYISEATQKNATSLGYKAHALASNSVSLGVATFTTGTRGIAIGTSGHIDQLDEKPDYERTWAAGEGSITLGTEARAVTESKRFSGKTEVDHDTNDAVAIGTRSDARATNSIALGGNMSYTNPETGHTTYGKQKGNDRDFGATVGEGAKSAIAIGGAYGNQVKNDRGDITALDVIYEAAATYGQRSIAVGTGATVANAEDFLDLKSMVDDKSDGGYQDLRKKYYDARANVTVAEKNLREYVRAHGEDGSDDYKSLVNDLDKANEQLTEATDAFSNKIKEKVALETKNAESVEDAVAIGTAARSEIAGGVALGSNSKIGYLDREGSSSTLTGYDVRTGLGYAEADSDSPAWKSTAASVAVGGGTVDGTLVTRRISYVAAGVFDTDAVNVAQLKRATNYTSDNRALTITEDKSGSMQLTSPFIHIEGIADASEKFGIASYDNANDFENVLNSEFTNLTDKFKGYNDEISELDSKIGNLNNKLQAAEAGRGTKYDEDEADYLVNEYNRLIAEAKQEKQFLEGRRDSTAAARQDLLNKYGSSAGDSLDSGKITQAYEESFKLKNEQARAIGKDSIATGKGSKAIGKDSIAIGRKSVVGEVDQTDMGNQSLAIGTENTVTGNQSIGIGTGHKVYGEKSGTMGDPNVLAANYSYVIGNENTIGSTTYKEGETITTQNIFIMGNYNDIPKGQEHVYVLGSDTIATASNSVILGDRSGYVEDNSKKDKTTKGKAAYASDTINGVKYDFAGGDANNVVGVVSVGYRDPSGEEVVNTRRIQNVAPGLITATSTDAINGSQLYAVMDGGLKFDANSGGPVTNKLGSTVSVIGEGTKDASAYSGKNIQTDISKNADGNSTITVKLDENPAFTSVTAEDGTNNTKMDANGIQITNNGSTVTVSNDGGTLHLGDGDNHSIKITNVADGDISEYSTDAINGSQLYQAIQDLTVKVQGDGTTTRVDVDKATPGIGGGGGGTGTTYTVTASTTELELGANAKENENLKLDVVNPTDDPKSYKYTIDMSNNLKLGRDGSVTAGDTTMNTDGLKVGDTTTIDKSGVTIKDGPSMTKEGFKYGDSTLNDTGLTVGDTKVNNDGLTIANGPSMTKDGINAADKKITNVGSGLEGENTDTNAANIKDVKDLATVVKEGEKTKVTSSTDDNGRFTYTVDLNDDAKATLDKAENKGLTFQADDGKDTGAIKLNETLQIKGDANIRTEATAGQMNIKLNENVDLGDTGSLRVGNTTVNSSGVTIANGPSMTDQGIDAGGKKITNVAKGEADTDAVNVAQLKEYVGDVPNLGNQISNVDNRAKKGIAGAAALAALHPMEFDPDDKLTFAAGMGHYRGETAAALGMFYRPDEKVMFSLGGTVGNGENMVNAGVSFSLDRTPRVTGSRTAMAKEIVQLREQVAQLTALVNQIAANQGMTMPVAPTIFPDTPENHYAYACIDQLQKQGYITGYAGRTLTRDEFAAAFDRAMAGGATLDKRIVKEFEPELSHVRVAHVKGNGNEEGKWYERPRFSYDKVEKHEIPKKHFRVQENNTKK